MRALSPALVMSDAQREILESLAKSQTAAHREVTRAKALLLAADGLASTAVAYEVGVSPSSVVAWRSRFAEEGLAKLGRVRPGRGRKPQIPAEKIDEIVRVDPAVQAGRRDALELPVDGPGGRGEPGDGAAYLAAAGSSRIWCARFKLSNDPRFEEKLDRCGRPLPEPARQGGGAVHGREEPDPGARPHAASAADEERPGRNHDPRLQAPWHHDPVRRAGRADRQGDRQVLAPAPQRRVPAVPAHHRPPGPQGLQIH